MRCNDKGVDTSKYVPVSKKLDKFVSYFCNLVRTIILHEQLDAFQKKIKRSYNQNKINSRTCIVKSQGVITLKYIKENIKETKHAYS